MRSLEASKRAIICGSMFSATNQKHLFRRFSSFLFIFGFSFALDKVKFPPFYPPPSNDIQNILLFTILDCWFSPLQSRSDWSGQTNKLKQSTQHSRKTSSRLSPCQLVLTTISCFWRTMMTSFGIDTCLSGSLTVLLYWFILVMDSIIPKSPLDWKRWTTRFFIKAEQLN